MAWMIMSVIMSGVAAHNVAAGRAEAALGWRPHSSSALSLAAEEAWERGSAKEALNYGRRALSANPIDARALRVIGLVVNAEGRRAQARAIMTGAIHLNRRDAQTQSWLFDDALGRQDYKQALLHADVLMRRSDVAAERLPVLLLPYARVPAAREAIAGRLVLDPPWRSSFLTAAAQTGDVEAIGALFESLRQSSRPPEDAELTPFFQRLVVAGRAIDAGAYWPRLTGLPDRSDPPFVYDGGFDGLRGPTPLTWQTARVLGGSAVFELDDSHPLGFLRLQHDGFSSSTPMLRQLTYLPPGSFTLRARALITDPAADERFRLEVVCINGSKLGALPMRGEAGRWIVSESSLDVPPETCPAQWVVFRPNTVDMREPVEMMVDDVEISPGLKPLAANTAEKRQ